MEQFETHRAVLAPAPSSCYSGPDLRYTRSRENVASVSSQTAKRFCCILRYSRRILAVSGGFMVNRLPKRIDAYRLR